MRVPENIRGGKREHDRLSAQLEDLQRELRELRQNMGRQVQQKKGVPFAENIMRDDMPASFRPVAFEYDGTTDPWDHVCWFENTALLHRFADGIKCRVFATTLTKSAQL